VKRLNQLRPRDLERVPIWRYEGSNDDNAVIHATDRVELSEDEKEVFIARTQFALANGAQHVGFCSPADDSGLDYLQPAIVTSDGLVYFWFDRPPSKEMLEAQWRRLGVTEEGIFPVHFRCTVPVDGRYVTGIIESDDLTGAA
jgi:hypothetical protein